MFQCSMCLRPAAWLIDNEVFCEPHKELMIEAFELISFRSAGLQIRSSIHAMW